MKLFLVCATFFASQLLCISAKEICGLAKPDDTKTCISLKLPWEENPTFFCTDKENIQYVNQCDGRFNYYGCNYGQKTSKSLQVSTPWDCCPITSVPDPCEGATCPKAPFNRTCVEEDNNKSKKSRFECCVSYFCEDGLLSRAECHNKVLLKKCNSPPKNKKNCIGFFDNFGCCNKYQCENEGKEGMCPAEAKALRFKQLIEDPKNGNKSVAELASKTEEQTTGKSVARSNDADLMTTSMECVGDYNCPGKMKCCGMNMQSYHGIKKYLSQRRYMFFENNDEDNVVIHGYCMDPISQ